ncbi:MAG: Gfo/Idh/MocA family oxidoreductase [Armatimonadetes bacterium]|nr:Gfo/Idh/MocA family oxidoreductase [Armatimonadota bacterium]
MREPVRTAIIGVTGMMGETRLGQLQEDPRAEVVMAVGRDLGRLREAIPDEGVRLATRLENVLGDDVDAVVVSTCNVLHYEQVKAALAAGKHVLCEYPLVDDLGQYDELVALAQGNGVVLHHGLTVRAESLHRTMKETLAKLGEPRAAYYRYYGGAKWYIDPALRGDMFCGLHIHFIDQFIDLFGQPSGIAAHGIEKDRQVSATVMMKWASGLVGTIEFAMGFADKPGYMGTIVTTDGWCGFSTDPEMHVTVERGGERAIITPPPDTSKAEDTSSFLDEVLGTGGPLSDLETGRRAIELCLECSRQLR